MCHEKLYQTDATSQTEEIVENEQAEDDVELNRQVVNGVEDENQNYLEDDSEDYTDLTDSDDDPEE